MKILLFFLAFLAFAQSPECISSQVTVANAMHIEGMQIEMILKHDGTYEEVVDRTVMVTDQATLQQWRNLQIRFRPDVLDIIVTRIEIQSLDGTKQTLPVHRKATIDPKATAENFANGMLQFAIPSLQIGDKLSYQVRINHKVQFLDGQFSISYHIQPYVINENAILRLRIPTALSLKLADAGFDTRNERMEGDDRLIELNYRHSKSSGSDPNKIDELLHSPYIIASSFGSYSQLGRAIGRRFSLATNVTPEIDALARRIVGERRTVRAKATALYDWVAANLAYDDSDIYADGVTPHSAATILIRNKGDCKDHVVLLTTLLRAVGIESTPLLISTENNFTLPPVAVAQFFNHVIVYIPSLATYIDATHGSLPFGVLPQYELGKPILELNNIGKVSRTPQRTLMDASISQTSLVLASDGSVRGDVTAESRGTLVGEIRRIARTLTPPRSNDAVKAALLASGLTTPEGMLQFSDDDASNTSRTHLVFRGNGALKLKGTAELILNVYLKNSYSLGEVVKSFSSDQSKGAFLCGARHVEENFIIDFPIGAQVGKLPPSAHYRDLHKEYLSNYVLERLAAGTRVHVTRRLLDSSPNAVCDEAEYQDFHRLSEVVGRDLGARISYSMR